MTIDSKMEQLQGTIAVFSENRYIKTVSKSMVMTLPATMTGALLTLIKTVQISGWQEFVNNSGLANLLNLGIMFTTNIMSLYVVFFVAYNLTKSFKIDAMVAGILGIASFLIFTPLSLIDVAGDGTMTSFINFGWIGSKGMFVGIIVGLLVGRIYSFFILNKITIKMPESVPSFVEKSFASLIPFFVIILLSTISSWLFSLTSYGSIHEVIYGVLQIPLQKIGGSLGGVLIAYILIGILWWFGLHGKILVFTVIGPIWQSMTIENLNATAAGEVPPHMIDWGFTTIFMEIGGAGCAFGLALLFTFFAKSERYKGVGKITFLPTFFGISEPITFSTPIVLNPHFFIPTVFTPLVTGLIGYGSIIIGFVPKMKGIALPTGVPTFMNAFMVAGWQALVVQTVCVIVAVACYYPFFRKADKEALMIEKEIEDKNEMIGSIETT